MAGSLCVAFVNTAAARPENDQQGVTSYAELLTWGQQTHLLSAAEAERLARIAKERPEEAAAVLSRAVALREALRRIFRALWSHKPAPADALQLLNLALREAFSQASLGPGEKGMTIGWIGSEDALDRMLWGVVHSAMETLTSTDAYCVRKCAAADCGLHFVDRTPSRRRKWCVPELCGNRVKALRYYYRKAKKKRDDHENLRAPRPDSAQEAAHRQAVIPGSHGARGILDGNSRGGR